MARTKTKKAEREAPVTKRGPTQEEILAYAEAIEKELEGLGYVNARDGQNYYWAGFDLLQLMKQPPKEAVSAVLEKVAKGPKKAGKAFFIWSAAFGFPRILGIGPVSGPDAPLTDEQIDELEEQWRRGSSPRGLGSDEEIVKEENDERH